MRVERHLGVPPMNPIILQMIQHRFRVEATFLGLQKKFGKTDT